ncbi:MAG: chromosome segregation protein SMC [Micromonosporaceae bacterium]|nr:chromosome segregation protein SMC [Micromonosporaceae bacterium]
MKASKRASGLVESTAPQRRLPVPAHAFPHRTPRELIALARAGLAEAAEIRQDGMRYATAHLAALRAAAAMLSARAIPAPPSRRGRVTSVWSLLIMVSPELAEWASFFSAGASKRAAAEAGIPRVVSRREADDLLRAVEQFIGIVEVGLGLSYRPPVPEVLAS